MQRISFVFWCYAILLVVAPLDLQQNSTSTDMTVRYESDIKFMEDQRIQMKQVHNLRENFSSDDNEMRPEFFTNITKENHEGDNLAKYQKEATRNYEDNHMSDIDADAMKTKNSNTAILHEQHEDLNEGSKNKTECVNNTCIPLCCSLGDKLIKEKCITGNGNYSFPIGHRYIMTNSSQIQEVVDDKTLDQMFHLIVNDPCRIRGRFLLKETNNFENDGYYFLANGFLYQPHDKKFIDPESYCLAIYENKYEVTVCKKPYPIIITIGVIISIPFLLATCVVYSILPELRNMHGYTLRAHVSSLFIAYIILAVFQQNTLPQLGYNICIILAYLLTFSFSASFFWLNIMSFDIWWLFRKPYAAQGNMKYQERRKFALYALYGWGCPFILIIICAMVEFVFDVPKNFVRPEFCIHNRWFSGRIAKAYYFYIPVAITIICNIVLFILTTLTIARHKKDTQQHLKNSEHRRHNDKKQWFKMYLKLFILMGITWIMEILATHSWILNSPPRYIWYPTDIINALQGVIIFIIFVWKKKIRMLLMKRFGCQNSLSRNSASSGGHSTSTSRTISSISLQSTVPSD